MGEWPRRERGWCWRCTQRRADILTYEDPDTGDSRVEASLCGRCKNNDAQGTQRWLERKPRSVEVNGVKVDGWVSDEQYYKWNSSLGDHTMDRRAFEEWRDDGQQS